MIGSAKVAIRRNSVRHKDQETEKRTLGLLELVGWDKEDDMMMYGEDINKT